MLKHIIMWTFKEEYDGSTKAENVLKAKGLLDQCIGLVPGQGRFEARMASMPGCTADLMLYSEFSDEAALKAYQAHPTHVALAPFLRAAVSGRMCMDYID